VNNSSAQDGSSTVQQITLDILYDVRARNKQYPQEQGSCITQSKVARVQQTGMILPAAQAHGFSFTHDIYGHEKGIHKSLSLQRQSQTALPYSALDPCGVDLQKV